MADIIDLLWLILISIVTFMLYRIHKDKRVFENFENSSDISSNVIKIYYENFGSSTLSHGIHIPLEFSNVNTQITGQIRVIFSFAYLTVPNRGETERVKINTTVSI